MFGFVGLTASAGCAGDPEATEVRVTFETSAGSFQVQLEPAKAPVTTSNFLAYVDARFFDGLVFHRVVPGFVVQGGGYTPTGEARATNGPIGYEGDNGLLNDKGTIAMARPTDPNSASSQFYINLVDNNSLNHQVGEPGYTVFGKITQGMETIYQIEALAEQDSNLRPPQHAPSRPVEIISAKRD